MAVYVADGTTIARSNANSPLTYTNFPQVVSIGTVGQDRGLIDITNLSSTAREYKKAIKDGQEIEVVMQYDPDDTTQAALKTDNNSENARSYRVTLSDSPAQTITFNALVTNWSIVDIAIDNVLGLRCVLKPTGDLSFSA
jgi:hypothetical protein